jgi:hypothetical protein
LAPCVETTVHTLTIEATLTRSLDRSRYPEDLIFKAYFGERVSKRALAAAIKGLQLDGEARGGSVTELDAAVAAIVLWSRRDELPQWASIENGKVTLGRINSVRVRFNRFKPKRLFVLNWADSGPGFSWPMAYFATPLHAYKRIVVTASADTPDTYGFSDFALGSFDSKRDLLDGAHEIIVNSWEEQASWGQERWAYLFDEGLVNTQLAEQWADEVWSPEDDDDTENNADSL